MINYIINSWLFPKTKLTIVELDAQWDKSSHLLLLLLYCMAEQTFSIVLTFRWWVHNVDGEPDEGLVCADFYDSIMVMWH